MADIETFRCVKHQGVRLTRDGCAKRHKSAAATYGPQNLRTGKVWSAICGTCPVGIAHLAGERPTTWPDGTPLEAGNVIPAGALLRSEPARRRARAATRPAGSSAAWSGSPRQDR